MSTQGNDFPSFRDAFVHSEQPVQTVKKKPREPRAREPRPRRDAGERTSTPSFDSIETTPVQPDVPAPTAAADAPVRRAQGGRKKSKPSAPDLVEARGFNIPAALRRWLGDTARTEGVTYSDLLLEAFDTIADTQLRREFAAPKEAPAGGMPRTPASSKRAGRAKVEDGVQLQIRLSGAQDDWLNQQVEQVNAPSRSALVSAVFALYREAKEQSK